MKKVLDLNTISFFNTVITFKHRCSLDGGRIYCTVNACVDNVDEFIPLNGPWEEEYKYCVWHLRIRRSYCIKDVLFEDINAGEDIY